MNTKLEFEKLKTPIELTFHGKPKWYSSLANEIMLQDCSGIECPGIISWALRPCIETWNASKSWNTQLNIENNDFDDSNVLQIYNELFLSDKRSSFNAQNKQPGPRMLLKLKENTICKRTDCFGEKTDDDVKFLWPRIDFSEARSNRFCNATVYPERLGSSLISKFHFSRR